MIRVSSSKWMLLALLSVMLTTNSADTTLEAELGHPDVQFSENSMEGVRLARAAPKTTNSNNAKGGVKSNGGTAGSGGTAVSGGTGGNKTAAGNGNAGVTGGAGGATVPTQPSKAAANSGVEPSTTMTPPDTNPTITTIATQPETTKTTTETTPTTLKTTEGTTPTTKVPEVLKSTFLRQQCQVHSPFDGCVDKLLDCLSENPPCNSTVANAAKKAAREIDTYKNCPDTECAGKQIKTLTTALEEEENARCQNGYKNSCKKEWEKTLKDLTACPKGSPDLRCMPKKTVPTPTPPTPEAPNSTVIYDFCKKDPKGFDACVNKLLECQKVTPLCDFNIAEASKKAARSIYDYKKCSDLKCAKGQETALKNALNEEENVRCKGDPSCTLEAQNTIAQLTDCSLDPTASRCIPKSLDIFESCPNDNTYAGCVNKQLDCQNTCQPGLAEDAREAAYKIVSYLQCEDSVCAKDKETELEEALKKEATSRCKGNPSCVPEWQDTLKIVTDCSSDPNVSRCKPPTTTTTTPALPAQVEAPKAKDIYEFCKKALQPFDTCVSDQLSICQSGTSSCDSNVVTAVKNAVNVIYEYDKSPDSKSADEKKDKLRKALEYEADVRCKGDPSCISSTEVQKTFDEVTACPDPLLPRCGEL
ncbi:hypothetical protein B9Z55_013045 [Caenorhabditis nigoni]|uniref:DUF19 domain-containing protein n=1 Tax=Caenorhabditis nigoni TaxID=1611254 RepID=A0A2G5TZV4_9PELO|nr:hypothetical protein B9Z55_013045 [Caenorhabditis nigoni]